MEKNYKELDLDFFKEHKIIFDLMKLLSVNDVSYSIFGGYDTAVLIFADINRNIVNVVHAENTQIEIHKEHFKYYFDNLDDILSFIKDECGINLGITKLTLAKEPQTGIIIANKMHIGE